MNFQLTQSCAAMPQSLPGRFAFSVGEATRAAVFAFQSSWREQAVQREETSTLELMTDINAHTLRDIGAPNWLIAQAVERRGSHSLHLIDLYRS